MQEAFEKKIEEKEIPKDLKIEKTSAVRASKSQKIKTDNGHRNNRTRRIF